MHSHSDHVLFQIIVFLSVALMCLRNDASCKLSEVGKVEVSLWLAAGKKNGQDGDLNA